MLFLGEGGQGFLESPCKLIVYQKLYKKISNELKVSKAYYMYTQKVFVKILNRGQVILYQVVDMCRQIRASCGNLQKS